jgi:hypothetical protein
MLLPVSPAYPAHRDALNRRGLCLQECIPGRGKTTRVYPSRFGVIAVRPHSDWRAKLLVRGLQSFAHETGRSMMLTRCCSKTSGSSTDQAAAGRGAPVLLKGGETVKSLSAAFLADLEEDWRQHGKEIFPVLREKYPQAYFQGIMSLARIIRWDVDPTRAFDRTLSPDEIMDKLEERVGPEGRKLFEKFIRQVNVLQAKQQLEAQAQMGVTERSDERGPG